MRPWPVQATEGPKHCSHQFEVESLAVVAPPGCRLQKGVLGRGPHLGWGERGEDHILQVKRELLTECTCMQGELSWPGRETKLCHNMGRMR